MKALELAQWLLYNPDMEVETWDSDLLKHRPVTVVYVSDEGPKDSIRMH
jgi:hypothetical protein